MKTLIGLIAVACLAVPITFAETISPFGKYKINNQYTLDVCVIKISSKSPELSGKKTMDLLDSLNKSGIMSKIINKNGVVDKYLYRSYPQSTLMLNSETIVENTTLIRISGDKRPVKIGLYMKANLKKSNGKLFTELLIENTIITNTGKDEYPVVTSSKANLNICGTATKWNLSSITIKKDDNGDDIWEIICGRVSPKIKKNNL